MQRIPSFLTSNECEAGDELIKAYVKGEEEKFRKQTTRSIVTTIYPVSVHLRITKIVRKLRDISVPKEEQHNLEQEG